MVHEITEAKSNYPRFLLLWSGELVSAVGGGLTSFGLSVYVFSETGSAANMAMVALIAFLPNLLLSVPAGVFADRYDRRLLMMLGDGLSAIGVVYILACMMTGGAKLWQICAGVFVSAVFSSLLEPSYRATVTDLLSEEEYSRASGMVSIAGSARYLISPLLAGLLLRVADIRLLLVLDICTFALTVVCTGIVKRGIGRVASPVAEPFGESLRTGWKAITEKRGVFILIMVSSVMTCFMGALQILAEPLVLDFRSSTALGIAETVCACGMLVSGIYLGTRGIRGNFVRVLSVSLAVAGAAMVGFGIRENICIICIFGFLFFACLPFANNCLDYLVRTNIEAEKQGRAWGLIGFLSQMGYVVAYGLFGYAADGIAGAMGVGVGRGAAAVIVISGFLLAAVAFATYRIKCVRGLEHHHEEENADQ